MSKKNKSNEEIPELTPTERLIHQPARLRIMAYLYVVNKADMVFLKSQTGLTWGNLSSHISKLEEAELVEVEKTFEKKKPLTILSLTKEGRIAFENYRDKMNQLLGDLK